MVNFKEIYHFSKFQRGSNIFQGGGGVQLLIPYLTHITCDFPGGGGSGPPVLPFGSALKFTNKTYAVGIQKNNINEMVLFNTP